MSPEQAEFVSAMTELNSLWNHIEETGRANPALVESTLERAAKAWEAKLAITMRRVPAFGFSPPAPPARTEADDLRGILMGLQSSLTKASPTDEELIHLAMVNAALELVTQ